MNNYSITFVSLRAGTVYTVNIGGGTGVAIPLKGGAQPFTTQEDDSDDIFTPIRTQTGYIRIVDDGFDARTPAQAFNWKDLLPATDTSRPVTLTANGMVVWQGFMQAQNFGGTLYGNPQEREFPVQCPLTILEGTDINYQHTEIENFAYLLQRIVNTIDVVSGGTETNGIITANGSIHINNIYVQGSADAQEWLLKRIDWQNFVSMDADGNIVARFNLYQILEDICRFWGWTARTHGQDLYLTCADDISEQTWLTMTRAQLDTMAGGSSAGTTGGAFSTVTLSGDIFANTNQDDYQVRGPNKATVTADGNTGDNEIIRIFPNSFVQEMTDGGTYAANGGGFGGSGMSTLRYTTDKTSFDTPLLEGSCRSGYATFNVMSFRDDAGNTQSFNVVKIKKSYASGATAFATLATKYEHVYSGDVITISGTVYRGGEKFEDKNGAGIGQKHMYIRLGVGKTRNTASWYVSGGRTPTWSNTPTDIAVIIGGESTDLVLLSMQAKCSGNVFLELVGSNDLSEVDGERSFDLADLILKVERSNRYYEVTTNQYGNFASLKTKELSDSREYNSSNGNNVRQDWNADCIYASDNDMNFGFGVIANADDSYMTGFNYGGFGLLTRPEQHLANRVTAFWATSRRKLAVELRKGQISTVTPMNKTTIDGTTGYPIAFGFDWRDDIVKLVTMQL